MNIELLAQTGGIFSLLVFWHFVFDWLFQTHDEAMKKSKDHQIRAIHCLIYAGSFLPLLMITSLTTSQGILALGILFWSHFFIDTYWPVMMWVKHIRKPPEFQRVTFNPKTGVNRKLTDNESLLDFSRTSLGLTLIIVVDQLIHIAFLLPIAYMIAKSL